LRFAIFEGFFKCWAMGRTGLALLNRGNRAPPGGEITDEIRILAFGHTIGLGPPGKGPLLGRYHWAKPVFGVANQRKIWDGASGIWWGFYSGPGGEV